MTNFARTALILAIVCSGCAVGPDYKNPDFPLPEKFDAQPEAPAEEVDLTAWWSTFGDPALDQLIKEGLNTNLDVQLARERVREARALLLINYSGLLPDLSTKGSYTRQQNSKNAANTTTTTSSSDESGSSTPATPSTTSTSPINLFDAGFDATWELDVFGGTRRKIESAQDSLEAQIEARRDALVTFLSEIAQNYVILRGAQHEYAIVQKNIEAEQETLQLQQLRLDAGITNELTVSQAEAQLASTASKLPPISTQVEQSIHRLSVLLGKGPAELKDQLEIGAPIPRGPQHVPAGLPSELIRRRPDVRESERQLAAATADVGVATADFFPKFTLTGRLGLRSEELSSLINSNSLYWNAGPGVSLPIMQLGAIWQNVKLHKSIQKQALIQYQKTILGALEEVENTLVAYDREQNRLEVLQKGVDSNRRAFELARKLNEAGVVDFLNVLTAQQSLFLAEDELAQSERTVSANLIALYKALGGGWEKTDEDGES